MIVGYYSVSHLYKMYCDPEQRPHLQKYAPLLVIGSILWLTALILLVYYWNLLETWAKIIGICGLFFNVGGSLVTLLVIFSGLKNDIIPDKLDDSEDSLNTSISEEIPSNPLEERTRDILP